MIVQFKTEQDLKKAPLITHDSTHIIPSSVVQTSCMQNKQKKVPVPDAVRTTTVQ